MTQDEFNVFLGIVAGASILLALFNLAKSRKKGRDSVRMAFSCLMLAVAVMAYRTEGRFGPTTIACAAILVGVLILDVLLRAKRDAK